MKRRFFPILTAMLIWTTISCFPQSPNQYTRLREKYVASLTGQGLDFSDPFIRSYVTTNDRKIEGYLSKREPERTLNHVFSDIVLPARGEEDVDGSKNINTVYTRLRDISLGLMTPQSHYYHTKSKQNRKLLEWTLAALERMHDFYSTETFGIYYEDLDGDGIIMPFKWVDLNGDGIKQTDEVEWRRCNWWHMEIGVPRDLNDIIALLYDHLPEERRNAYLDAIDLFLPSPNWTTGGAAGANGTWATKNVALRAILAGNPVPRDLNTPRYKYDTDKLTAAKEKTESLIGIHPMESGYGRAYQEGFYEDGSFISHSRHPYTGGYGEGMLGDNIQLISLFEGSGYAISAEKKSTVSRWIREAFIPVYAYGSIMDCTRGRGLSRTYQSIGSGLYVLNSILSFVPLAPEEDRSWLMAFLKQQMSFLFDYIGEEAFYAGTGSDKVEVITPEQITIAKNIWSDPTVTPGTGTRMARIFPLMNRAVFHSDYFIAAVAAHSDRIYNYEGLNTENRKGWHTSDGMLYLYDRDYAQYNDGFWVTVDPYLLAGTTVEAGSDMESGNKLGRNAWCGGIALCDTLALFGQQLQPAVPATLSANKSWFFLRDIILCLGSGIRNPNPEKEVYTVIENRRIRNDNSNRVTVDGHRSPDLAGEETVLSTGCRWVHLSGNRGNDGTGYWLAGDSPVGLKREKRSGSWRDINRYEMHIDSTRLSGYHFSLFLDHGKDPRNAGYAYAVLPERTAEKTRDLSLSPPFTIVDNSSAVQAVRYGNAFFANLWEPGKTSDGFLESDAPLSAGILESEETLHLTLTDPTQGIDRITLWIPAVLHLKEKQERILTFGHEGGKTRIVFDTKDLFGQAVQATLSR